MKLYIVGNWKMNFSVNEASVYVHKLQQKLRVSRDLEVIIAPSTVCLQPLSLQLDRRKMHLAAQNANFHDFGAYTGETSFNQLRGLVEYCIIGHSERRQLFNQSDKDIRESVASAIRNHITPILCIGETATERTFGETETVLRDQLLGGLSQVAVEDLVKVIIAYEPVWAISTTTDAHLASPDDIADVVRYLRYTLDDSFSASISKKIPILYGGSVKPSNAGAYLTVPGVNGLLVGGASLIGEQFIDIIETAKRISS